jgi:hypothetical protein
MHKGICVGGPMAGQTITTGSDAGFVAVDAAGMAAWIYHIDPGDGSYQLDTSPDASLLDADGTRALDRDRAASAAAGKGLDVVALPGEDDEPAAEPPPIDDFPTDQDGDY